MEGGIGQAGPVNEGLRISLPARDLAAHASRGAAQGRVIEITIPVALPTINVLMRMHWAKRRTLGKEVATMIWAAMRQARIAQSEPIHQCRIEIMRSARREPDPDNLPSTAKLILDALQPASKRHPIGLGVIADDSSKCVKALIVKHVPGSGSTRITITGVA